LSLMSKTVRGQEETELLRQNLEDQLERLLEQLEDIELEKDHFTQDELIEIKDDTIEEMREMQSNLQMLMSGDMTLMSELAILQTTMQLAVSKAFQTPEVIKMFVKKDNGQLRSKLTSLHRDKKLGKVSSDIYNQQVVEILSALQKLGDKLSEKEENFLKKHMTPSLVEFETRNNESVGSDVSENIFKTVSYNIKKAQFYKHLTYFYLNFDPTASVTDENPFFSMSQSSSYLILSTTLGPL